MLFSLRGQAAGWNTLQSTSWNIITWGINPTMNTAMLYNIIVPSNSWYNVRMRKTDADFEENYCQIRISCKDKENKQTRIRPYYVYCTLFIVVMLHEVSILTVYSVEMVISHYR